jgi:hypothetical protein
LGLAFWGFIGFRPSTFAQSLASVSFETGHDFGKNRKIKVKPLHAVGRIKGTRFTWKREPVKKLGTFSVTKIPVELGLPELM